MAPLTGSCEPLAKRVNLRALRAGDPRSGCQLPKRFVPLSAVRPAGHNAVLSHLGDLP